jgi:hypothetical protein
MVDFVKNPKIRKINVASYNFKEFKNNENKGGNFTNICRCLE